MGHGPRSLAEDPRDIVAQTVQGAVRLLEALGQPYAADGVDSMDQGQPLRSEVPY